MRAKKKMNKTRYIETQWEKITYDIWGNEKDGFEVNQAFHSGTLSLRIPVTVYNAGTPQEFESATPTDKQLREVLDIRPRFQIETEGDDLTIYVNLSCNGYPAGELRCTSHESLSPIRAKVDSEVTA